MATPAELSTIDRSVLEVLQRHGGRVVSRATIIREADLGHLHQRRPDAAIAAIRAVLGPSAVVTVRSRGWMLTPGAATELRETGAESL